MNDAFGMNDRLYLREVRIIKPLRFDHFVALIEKRRAVDRDFFAHIPSGMRERVLCSNLFKLRRGKFKKGSAACC